jgi:hypothetical protein
VAHPQIAVFARLADKGQAPTRALFGQNSHLSRTMHDIRYDAMHDEIVVPVPYAHALLTFRGGADGQEAPIRVIQGPKTGGIGSRVDVDPVHNEIFTYRNNTILVYPRDANGDVAPIRTIQGPDTQLSNVYSLAVDPINNVLVVGLNSNWGAERANRGGDGEGGGNGRTAVKGAILVFNRTDQGNVKPRAVIRGDKSGIVRINQMQVYPQRKLIVVAMPGIIDKMEPPEAFVGVWSYDDNGDVPPRWKIPIGTKTKMKKPFGVVLNPKNKEVIVSDMRNQGILTYSVPEIF